MNRQLRRQMAQHHVRCVFCGSQIAAGDMAGAREQPLHRACVERLAQARAIAEQQKRVQRVKQSGIWLPGQQ